MKYPQSAILPAKTPRREHPKYKQPISPTPNKISKKNHQIN